MSASPLASFRKGAVTLGAVAAMTAASLFPAQGQTVAAATPQSDPVTTSTDCSKYRPGELMGDTKCEILKGKVIDVELVHQQQIGVCLRKIKVFFDQGKVSRDDIMKYGKERACDLAKSLG